MFKTLNAIAACILLAATSGAHAEPYGELGAVIETTSRLVREQFVDEATAAATADELLARYERGAYADIETAEQLQQRITSELREISGDTHIGVVYDPKSVVRYRAR